MDALEKIAVDGTLRLFELGAVVTVLLLVIVLLVAAIIVLWKRLMKQDDEQNAMQRDTLVVLKGVDGSLSTLTREIERRRDV
ncbi:MAG: hypothetical protein Q8K65_11805 [Alphaproteobacteria bacterium]|nr:hypothetical protein [Alphaproteobacteria bacterium]